jgi:hypothetical protein
MPTYLARATAVNAILWAHLADHLADRLADHLADHLAEWKK